MRFKINLPNGVELNRGRYVLNRPDGVRIDLGQTVAEVRRNYPEAAKYGVSSIAFAALMYSADQLAGPEACWTWTGTKDRDGYGLIAGKRVQRIVMHHLTGKAVAPAKVVMHSCDNPSCCNPRHLSIGTQRANIADRVRKDRSANGEQNGRARLTKEAAKAIRRSSESMAAESRKHGVSKWTIRDIRTKRTWRKIK